MPRKVIITCAVTGAIHTPSMSPYIPVTAQEIADAAIGAAQAGAAITDIAFCPHHPKAITAALRGPCDCRKPAAGMIFKLAKKWHIDCARSLVIGDRPSDVEAGNKAGCHSYLIDDSQRLDEFANQLLKIHRPAS